MFKLQAAMRLLAGRYKGSEKIKKFGALLKFLAPEKYKEMEARHYFDPARNYPAVAHVEQHFSLNQLIQKLGTIGEGWHEVAKISKPPRSAPELRNTKNLVLLGYGTNKQSFPILVGTTTSLNLTAVTIYMPDVDDTLSYGSQLGVLKDPRKDAKEAAKRAEAIRQKYSAMADDDVGDDVAKAYFDSNIGFDDGEYSEEGAANARKVVDKWLDAKGLKADLDAEGVANHEGDVRRLVFLDIWNRYVADDAEG